MSKVQAYAINTIVRREDGKKVYVPASTSQRVSVVEMEQEEFDRLEAAHAVRKATKDEVILAKSQSGEADAPTNVEKQLGAEEAKPASGAEGDPQGKPKGAAKAASKDEEI